jgi:prepilin-type N-terminal cleavage/methylation domain-containing protein
MPEISVCCQRSREHPLARGFTLLELLVVMALVATVTGLVVPAAQRGLDAAQARTQANDIQAQLASLPVLAYQRGDMLILDEPRLRQLLPTLPKDWQLTVPQGLKYSAAGVASGGQVEVTPPGRPAMVWSVQRHSGQVERVGSAAPGRER